MKTEIVLLFGFACFATSCQDTYVVSDSLGPKKEIRIEAEIDQISATRVNDSGFADGDRIGVFVVDFNADGTPGVLKPYGNRADNACLTYERDYNRWYGETIYWKDDNTPIDVYGYYPYDENIADVNFYPFDIVLDQSSEAHDGKLCGYEASDFLWAKSAAVTPGSVIHLSYKHIMAGVQVTIVQGEGFEEDEWSSFDKSVIVTNTVTKSAINMSDGTVSLNGNEKGNITAALSGSDFRAVVVPQDIPANNGLIIIDINGQSYTFSRNNIMTFYSGKLHKFTIKVDNAPKGDYIFTLVDESVTAWENDLVSHEAEAYRYFTVNVPQPGLLKESIINSGADYTSIRNLKVTGTITGSDFEFMNNEMSSLQALNLKEVKITGVNFKNDYNADDVIPDWAFNNNTSLNHIVFPDNLKKIGCCSFKDTQLLGSLTIPEGVTVIADGAFYGNISLTGSLNLPSTLEEIMGGNLGAFQKCGFTSELILPESLKKIGQNAFCDCTEIRGHLRLPENLEEIGGSTFSGMANIRGDIVIPDKVRIIPYYAFWKSGFDGRLYLPEKLQTIQWYAFGYTKIKGEVVIPENISILSNYAFTETDITHVIFPEGLQVIENGCFENCRMLQDTLKIPSGITNISSSSFNGCTSIEAIVLPENLKSIESSAFFDCLNINYIRCLSSTPPQLYDVENTFSGVAKDNFSVVVPANAVNSYRNAIGWSEFKRISAYRNFVCRPVKVSNLNNALRKELILNADGEWTVSHLPEWCHLSQTSGSNKTSITLTIDELENGHGNRNDSIVFSLEDGKFFTNCIVSQYDYQYNENEVIKLQSASLGNGIDLIWVGEGFDANDISNGTYLKKIREQVDYFFGIEPYKTYRDYFNVYTIVAMSEESGIGTLNTLRNVKFNSTLGDSNTRMVLYPELVEEYVALNSAISIDRLKKSLVVVCMNTSQYEGLCYMYPNGSAIAYCPHSTELYPYDARGIVQHEAGGHGFGKLGDEYIYHQAFIQTCNCTCLGCGHVEDLKGNLSLGFFRNLSLNGNYETNEWRHLIFDDRYSDIVDIFEGGYFHSRGVYRSEENSCMNNNIPYYSTISRQAIVERIMELAGEEFSFEKFAGNDSRKFGDVYMGTSRTDRNIDLRLRHNRPVLMKENSYE